MPKKVIFMGAKTIGANCLQILIDNQSSFDYEVVAVFGQKEHTLDGKNKNVQSFAQKHSIPYFNALSALESHEPVDIIFSVQYHKILKPIHIAKAEQIAVNLHMAPLPEYRGCNQFSFAIIDESDIFGTTLHQLESGIDNGAILFENRFPISNSIKVAELYAICETKSLDLFKKHIKSIIQGNYQAKEQRLFSKDRKSNFHLRKEINDIKIIDANWSKAKIARYFRATYFPPFPPPQLKIGSDYIDLTEENISQFI